MCVIIHKPKGILFSKKDIKAALRNNPDGFGYMYYDKKANKIVTHKDINWSIKGVIKVFESLKNVEACFHFRFRTDGPITKDLSHPFKILSKEDGDAEDIYFMHNGVITGLTEQTKNESDTECFGKTILRPILKKAPQLLTTKAFQILVEDFIGIGNKLCFMYGEGEVLKINEDQGSVRNKCWVSNTYSFREDYRYNKNKKHDHSNVVNYYTGYYSDEWDYDYTNNKQIQTKKTFLGIDVEVGSTVYVYDLEEDPIARKAIITKMYDYSLTAKYVGTNEFITFVRETGLPLNANLKKYVLPSKDFLEEENTVLTVEDYKKNKEIKKIDVKKSKDTKKEDLIMFEAENRIAPPYGLTEDDLMTFEYTKNVTITDFVNMSIEERASFFLEHKEAAFGMLQDLAEDIAYYGFYNNSDDLKFNSK